MRPATVANCTLGWKPNPVNATVFGPGGDMVEMPTSSSARPTVGRGPERSPGAGRRPARRSRPHRAPPPPAAGPDRVSPDRTPRRPRRACGFDASFDARFDGCADDCAGALMVLLQDGQGWRRGGPAQRHPSRGGDRRPPTAASRDLAFVLASGPTVAASRRRPATRPAARCVDRRSPATCSSSAAAADPSSDDRPICAVRRRAEFGDDQPGECCSVSSTASVTAVAPISLNRIV